MEKIKSFLSYRINWISILVGLIICFQLFIFFKGENDSSKTAYINKEISKLEQEVDVIYKSSKVLDDKIKSFDFEIKNIRQKVDVNNLKIEKLKKDEKIKIDNFNSYDARMYERYFADRYSKKQQ